MTFASVNVEPEGVLVHEWAISICNQSRRETNTKSQPQVELLIIIRVVGFSCS